MTVMCRRLFLRTNESLSQAMTGSWESSTSRPCKIMSVWDEETAAIILTGSAATSVAPRMTTLER